MASQLVKASLAAAAPAAICYAILYGFFGPVAGLIAGLVAFVVACCLAPLFLAVRPRLREPTYFMVHLLAGYLLGVLYASLDANADTLVERFASRDTTLPLASSLSAWAYLYLFSSENARNEDDPSRYRLWLIPPFILIIVGLGYLSTTRPYTEDGDCHNVLRDQRSQISPVESIRLSLPKDVEGELKSLYASFALKHELETRGHALHKTSAQTSMCNSRVTIRAGGFFEGRHGISVFELSPDSEWQALTEELVCDLKARWPDSLKFSDRGGYKHDTPRALEAWCYTEE